MERGVSAVDGALAPNDGQSKRQLARLSWLRERLAELGQSLGRVPTAAELSVFLRRHQVESAEIDDLVNTGRPTDSSSRPVSPAARAAADAPPVTFPSMTLGNLVAHGTKCDTELTLVPEPSMSPSGDGDRPRLPQDKMVGRAVDDIIDDWYRAGNALRYEDVTRLVAKRGLSAEQAAAVLVALEECGVEIEGLAAARPGFDDCDQPEREAPASVSPNAVRSYLGEIGRYALLWAEDEVRLGRQIQAGISADEILQDAERLACLRPRARARLREASAAGRRAHSEMVCSNLRLVVSIAKHRSYEGSGVEFIDRIQDGNAGLMRAANKFDPDRGFKFSTYATWWVRQFIERGIGDRGRLIRIPVHVHEKVQRLRRTQRMLTQRLNREPTLAELSEELEWEAGKVQAVIDWSLPLASLDVRIGNEGDLTFGDLLADRADVDGRTDPVDCVIESAWSRDLKEAMETVLSAREQEVIRRRYGFDGMDEETLDGIGEHFGLTRERIRQIQSKAMVKLRNYRGLGQLRIYLVDDLAEQSAPIGSEKQIGATVVQLRKRTRRRATKRSTTSGVAGVGRQQFLFETIGEIVGAS